MKSKPFTPQEFKEIYSKVPRLCIDIAIRTDKGVLLTKRSIPPAENMWHFPGGTVIFGETLKQAVVRVGRDELGVEIEPIQIISVLEYPSEYAYGQSVSVVFLCLIKNEEIKLNNEATEYAFVKQIPENTIPTASALLKSSFNLSPQNNNKI